MSRAAEEWVWTHSTARGNARMILAYMANQSNDAGVVSGLSVNRLATKARLHRSTVMNAIRRLERSGELLVMRRPGGRGSRKTNSYALLLERPPAALGMHTRALRVLGK